MGEQQTEFRLLFTRTVRQQTFLSQYVREDRLGGTIEPERCLCAENETISVGVGRLGHNRVRHPDGHLTSALRTQIVPDLRANITPL
ncbi:MAG: hypothetical protein KAZ88_14550 [Acidimicrobiia bacterium]|nr:hypothetical protein [Acidimicrobiia bacterium]